MESNPHIPSSDEKGENLSPLRSDSLEIDSNKKSRPITLSTDGKVKKAETFGWVRLLFLLAIITELGGMFLMTFMRYRFQELEPEYFAFNKTANLYGLILVLPFLILYLAGIVRTRYNKIGIGITAVILSGIGVLLLSFLITSPTPNQPKIGVAYLALKAFSLGLLLVMFNLSPRPLWRKIVSVLIFSLFFAFGTYLMVIASILVDPITATTPETRPRAEYDAGVILGAAVWSGDKPSPVFRERIRKGYDLLNNGTVEFLVLTGGNAPNELTEAEVAKRSLLALGADPTRIVLEDQTSSTVEQILFIRDELTKQGWNSFVIISDKFHLKRALEICSFNDIEANGIPSDSPLGPYNLAIYHVRESAALILYWMFGL